MHDMYRVMHGVMYDGVYDVIYVIYDVIYDVISFGAAAMPPGRLHDSSRGYA